jgi:hypothetical protein
MPYLADKPDRCQKTVRFIFRRIWKPRPAGYWSPVLPTNLTGVKKLSGSFFVEFKYENHDLRGIGLPAGLKFRSCQPSHIFIVIPSKG